MTKLLLLILSLKRYLRSNNDLSTCQHTHPESSRLDTAALPEAIHVELSDEGGHVGVLVVVRQHGLGELALVLDDEGAAVVAPGDQVV